MALLAWLGSARLGGVAALLAGLALCELVSLPCCQCVFCAKGFSWLPGDAVGLGEGFCCWHVTV